MSLECRHRGKVMREQKCTTCTGTVLVPVHACGRHSVCTQTHLLPQIALCRTCPERSPPEVPPPPPLPSPDCTTRHLLYHLYPRVGPTWGRNLDHLRRRIDLFNGRRICAVALDDTTASEAEVRDALCDLFPEVIVGRNDPALREARTLPLLLGRMIRDDPDAVLFWAHAKGVTRPVNPGVSVHPWTDILYETALDCWPLVHRTLCAHPVAGSFLKVGAGFQGSASAWHYSGSFFWARMRDLFWARWWQVDLQGWGIESYPSLHFPLEQAGCLFHRADVPTLNLYSMEYLEGVVYPDLHRWRAKHTEGVKA